ncbi:MAG: hypothetical protein ACRC62_15280 [Microcoleus sp.]
MQVDVLKADFLILFNCEVDQNQVICQGAFLGGAIAREFTVTDGAGHSYQLTPPEGWGKESSRRLVLEKAICKRSH